MSCKDGGDKILLFLRINCTMYRVDWIGKNIIEKEIGGGANDT